MKDSRDEIAELIEPMIRLVPAAERSNAQKALYSRLKGLLSEKYLSKDELIEVLALAVKDTTGSRPTASQEPRRALIRPVTDASYLAGPYRPDSTADAWSTAWATCRAASVRGPSHRAKGVPRQDDFAVAYLPESDSIIVSVCDGLSSARFAHLGATTAARVSVDELSKQLEASGKRAVDWPQLVQQTAWALVELARRFDGRSDPGTHDSDSDDYSTTLTTLILRRIGNEVSVEGLSIGDSGSFALLKSGHLHFLSGGKQPDSVGILSTATAALPRLAEPPKVFRNRLRDGDKIMIGTDGVLDGLLSAASDPEVTIRKVRKIAPDEVPSPARYMSAIDESSPFQIDDDRTLVCVWIGPLD